MASAIDVANCFLYLDQIHDGDGISNLKLQKLVYYAQGFHLAIFGKELFPEKIEAWNHGPVVPDLYHAYKQYGSNLIPAPEGYSCESLSDEEQELVTEVFQVYGQFSAWKLRDLTHQESPWIENEAINGVISPFEMMEYFQTRLK